MSIWSLKKMYYGIWEMHNTILTETVWEKKKKKVPNSLILSSRKRVKSVSFPCDSGWMCGGFNQQCMMGVL